jgi:hypothetical protein
VLLPSVIFLLFATISTVGAYLLTAHFRDRRAALGAASATLLFFVALAVGLVALLRGGGIL